MLVGCVAINAQSDEKKFEIGGQFSVLRRGIPVRPQPFSTQNGLPEYEYDGINRYGFGGRLTYNFNKYLAVEGEGNVFIGTDREQPFPTTGETFYQGQFGIKAGKRFSKFGVFAKGRPGFVRLREQKVTVTGINNGVSVSTDIEPVTYFSTDIGGVLEFYPSKRIVTRVDVGDTIINFPGATGPQVFSFPSGGVVVAGRPADQEHNLQISFGLGYRF